ncbi:MAG: Hsp20/alpha crystallin family protein [Alphaproteobacteria bacterium]|nr:Hsp20/alpha crystallin family protein [Alphaproteobacteria bacterium]
MVCSKCGDKRNLPQKNYGKKVSELRHDINRAFDNFFNVFDYPLTPLSDFSFIEPKVELVETENDVRVSAELPGMNDDDIEIDVSEDGFLTIKGEKRSNIEEKSDGRYFSERSYGMVSRTLPLPNDIDIDKTEAKFTNGVLKIVIPKTPLAKQKIRKIKVKK